MVVEETVSWLGIGIGIEAGAEVEGIANSDTLYLSCTGITFEAIVPIVLKTENNFLQNRCINNLESFKNVVSYFMIVKSCTVWKVLVCNY